MNTETNLPDGDSCVPRLVLRCNSCQHQQWSAATMDDPYPHVWCDKGHWEGAEPSGITEDPWKDCTDFLPKNAQDDTRDLSR